MTTGDDPDQKKETKKSVKSEGRSDDPDSLSKKSWRKTPPGPGEKHTKQLKSRQLIRWCEKCEAWGGHSTKTHKTKEELAYDYQRKRISKHNSCSDLPQRANEKGEPIPYKGGNGKKTVSFSDGSAEISED
jgi:hypothetical protein